MHIHDGFDQESNLRPRASRMEEAESAGALKAAVSGRLDAAGTSGVMGLQRAIGNAGTTELIEQERSPVHDVIGSGGSAMEPTIRADMESRLGHDFGDVRIHTDAAAHDSAKSVNAQAYTVGSDVVFQQGKYEPGSPSGQHMLAHELTHVVQQRNGPVEGTDAGGGVKVSDPSDRFERDAVANADRVMATAPPTTHDVQRSADGAVPMVQREESETEEEDPDNLAAAQTFVQRHEDCAEHDS